MKIASVFFGLLAMVSANPFQAEEEGNVFSLASLESRATEPTCTYSLKNPQPQGIYCNAVGQVRRPSPIAGALTTFAQCRNSCLSLTGPGGCLSFSRGPKGFCTLYNNTIADMGFKAQQGGAAFYNRRCFKETCMCDAGSTLCGSSDGAVCVDTMTDDDNCGGCNNACMGSTMCLGGQCVIT